LLGLAKYLPEFGWQPVILTAPLRLKPEKEFNIVETPYRDALGFWKHMLRLLRQSNVEVRIYEGFGHALDGPEGDGHSIFRNDALSRYPVLLI
jgi:hypothetical protein